MTNGYKKRLSNILNCMKQRCYNKNNPGFYRYGGRGIDICNEWMKSPEAFYQWSIRNGYSDELSIDRIDNNKGYSPENCRWVTVKEQNNNTRSNRMITFEGKTQTMAEWADEVGIKYACLEARINRLGWSLERALR